MARENKLQDTNYDHNISFDVKNIPYDKNSDLTHTTFLSNEFNIDADKRSLISDNELKKIIYKLFNSMTIHKSLKSF